MKQIHNIKENMTLPVIMAPMFLISNPKMVIEACKNGIIGSFPALNARTHEILEEWLIEITNEYTKLKNENREKKIAPWAINFISHRSNKRFFEDLRLIEKYQPPIVITSLGDPSPVVEIVHQYGGLVFSDVIDIKFAKKAIEKGTDGLILVASGAGGHGGTYNPIAFIHEVKKFWNGPIILAGAISRGEDVLASEVLGADFAYIGSRFIPAEESMAIEDYKDMILESTIEDIVYTDAFSGVNGNYLVPSIIRAGIDPGQLQRKKSVDFSSLATENIKAWRDIWAAGQGVGAVDKKQTVSEIVSELIVQYEESRAKISRKKERNTEHIN